MENPKVSTLHIPPKVFKFTESSVLKKTGKRGRGYICKDSEDTKLQIQVWKSGRKVYRTDARVKGGQPTKVTHGVVGEIILKEVRNMHHEAMALIRQGINPNNVIQEEEIPSIRTSITSYIKYNKDIAPTTKKLYEGLLANHLTHKMFSRPFEELKEESFKKWHKGFEKKEKEAVAINCLKLLSATFNAQPQKITNNAENPRLIIKRNKGLYKQKTKDDVFLDPGSDDDGENEVEIFLQLLMDVHYGWYEPKSEDEDSFFPPTQNQVYIDAILLMLLTGVRVNAIVNLTWEDVNWKKGIFIAHEKGRLNQKKIRIVPLTKYTYRLLRHREEQNRPKKSQWVFPSMILNPKRKNGKLSKKHTKGKKHIRNPKHIFNKKMKRRASYYSSKYQEVMDKIDRHGLRRTISRVAQHLGYDMDTLRGVLDHSNSGVTVSNYLGGEISEKRLRKCYEDCHNYIDNRMVKTTGFIPVFMDKEDMNLELKSPLLALWGKPEEPLEPDEYLLSFKHSGFAEETTAFPDMD